MKKQEILHDVPQAQLALVVADFESEGARVTSAQTRPGFFTVTATWDEVPSNRATPGTAGVAAVAAVTPPAAAAGPLSDLQRQAAEAIINIFETGEVLGDYGQVTLIPGDTGHLTFGRSQTTLGSGNLAQLLQLYVDQASARFGHRLRPLLPRFRQRDTGLDADTRLHNLLRATADDPVMREVQDRFFAATYWQPALAAATHLGLRSALGVAVVYDSHVHGSWALIRDRVNAQSGGVDRLGERPWVTAYVTARGEWLAGHPRDDLRRTVYRMEAFDRLIANGLWNLALPLVVRGREISPQTLGGQPPGCYSGPAAGSRVLEVQSPLARGLDVRTLQLALSDRGVDLRADGVFGQASQQHVRAFQQAAGLPVTGTTDAALWAALA